MNARLVRTVRSALFGTGVLCLAVLAGCDPTPPDAPGLPLEAEFTVADGPVDYIAASDDLAWFASIRPTDRAMVYDRAKGQWRAVVEFDPDPVCGAGHRRIAFRPGTHVLGLPSKDEQSLTYYDCEADKVVFAHAPGPRRIDEIFFSADGQQAATTSSDCCVRFFRCGEVKPTATYQADHFVYFVVFLPRHLAAVFTTGKDLIVDTTTGAEVSPRFSHGGYADFDISPRSETVVVVRYGNSEFGLLDAATGQQHQVYSLPRKFSEPRLLTVDRVAIFTSSSQGFFSSHEPHRVEVWDVPSRKCLGSTVAPDFQCRPAVSAEGNKLVATYPRLGAVQVFDISGYK